MAREVAFQWKTAGADQVLKGFDELTKKEQEAIVKGSKLGKKLDQIDKKAKRTGKTGSKAFGDIVKGMLGAQTASSIVQKGLAIINAELERQIDLNRKVGESQQSFSGILGKFRLNNAPQVAQDQNLINRMEKFSIEQGKKLGEGGAKDVLQGVVDLRGKAGEGFTEEQQMDAIGRAVIAKRADPGVDIGSMASANLKLQQVLLINATKAQNMMQVWGTQVAGNMSEFVKQIGKIKGGVGAARGIEEARTGKASTNLFDVLSLYGAATQSFELSPEEATTKVMGLLDKISSARIGSEMIKFKSEDKVEQVYELAERMIGGEFAAKDEQKVLSSAGLLGVGGKAFLFESLKNREKIKAGGAALRRGTQEGVDYLRDQDKGLTEREKNSRKIRQAQGELDAARLMDVEGGRRDTTIQEMKAIRDEEKFGLLQDPLASIREFAVSTGVIGEIPAKALLETTRQAQLETGIGDLTVSPFQSPLVGIAHALGSAVDAMNGLVDELKDGRHEKATTVAPDGGE